jgi:hypothetical protein
MWPLPPYVGWSPRRPPAVDLPLAALRRRTTPRGCIAPTLHGSPLPQGEHVPSGHPRPGRQTAARMGIEWSLESAREASQRPPDAGKLGMSTFLPFLTPCHSDRRVVPWDSTSVPWIAFRDASSSSMEKTNEHFR